MKSKGKRKESCHPGVLKSIHAKKMFDGRQRKRKAIIYTYLNAGVL